MTQELSTIEYHSSSIEELDACRSASIAHDGPIGRAPAGVFQETGEGELQVGADEIWRALHRRANEVAVHEPLLAGRMHRLVLQKNSMEAVLAAVLASRLANYDLPEPVLYAKILAMFSEDKRIGSQIAADLQAVKTRDPASPDYLHVVLNLKGFQALQTHKVSHLLWRLNRKELAYTFANLAALHFNVDIHPAARIGSGVMFDHGGGIVIGETAVIDDSVSILQQVTLGGTGKDRGDRHPKIRSGVMIGAGAKILGNIEIGTMSKVAAGSVVLKDVPPHSTVAGVPAVVRRRHAQTSPAFDMQQII